MRGGQCFGIRHGFESRLSLFLTPWPGKLLETWLPVSSPLPQGWSVVHRCSGKCTAQRRLSLKNDWLTYSSLTCIRQWTKPWTLDQWSASTWDTRHASSCPAPRTAPDPSAGLHRFIHGAARSQNITAVYTNKNTKILPREENNDHLPFPNIGL